MIKAIIFDCFGVLTGDKWKEFCATLPADKVDQARGLNHAYDAGLINKKEFSGQIFELTGKHPTEVEQLLDNEIIKNTQLLTYIKELKDTYKIGLLSNIATDWIQDQFLTKDEQVLFDDMVFSHTVGMTKPDPRIFSLACERLGVEPEQAVLIDDITRYCEAAKETGMQAVVYTDFPSMKQQLEALLANANN